MTIAFSDVTIETRRGPRRVLVTQPSELVTLGQAQIQARNDPTQGSPIDREIVRELARSKYEVLVFRAQDGDGRPRYQFDPAIPESELPAAGKQVVRAQIPLYRELARHGIIVTVAAELGDRELLAFRGGTAGLVHDAESRADRGPGGTERFDLDLWLLRHMTLFSSLSLDGVLTQLLPTSVPMLEPRVQRIRNLL